MFWLGAGLYRTLDEGMPGREVRNFSATGMAAEDFLSDSARRKLAVFIWVALHRKPMASRRGIEPLFSG